MSRFETQDLPFAAFLICTKKIDFLHCEKRKDKRVFFIFADPENIGQRLYLEYENGALIPAVGFYNTVRFLRQTMDNTLGRERKERRYYEHRLECGRSNYRAQ